MPLAKGSEVTPPLKRLPGTTDKEWQEQLEERKRLAEERMNQHDKEQEQ